jgi:hypothetical protein
MQSGLDGAQSGMSRLLWQKLAGRKNPFFHSTLQKQVKTTKKTLIVRNPPETLAAYQRW